MFLFIFDNVNEKPKKRKNNLKLTYNVIHLFEHENSKYIYIDGKRK
jgi:hypothetical protein